MDPKPQTNHVSVTTSHFILIAKAISYSKYAWGTYSHHLFVNDFNMLGQSLTGSKIGPLNMAQLKKQMIHTVANAGFFVIFRAHHLQLSKSFFFERVHVFLASAFNHYIFVSDAQALIKTTVVFFLFLSSASSFFLSPASSSSPTMCVCKRNVAHEIKTTTKEK